MAKLEHVDVRELEDGLERTDGSTETMRLLTAIIYKRGPSVPMIAEWLDIRETTIYRWFDRLEDEPIESAIRNRPRPGRPPKLSETQFETFRLTVRRPPAEVGLDEPAWSPDTARAFLSDRFDIDYSIRDVQRLLKAAGLRHRPAGEDHAGGAEDGQIQYWEPAEVSD